ncbi:MAG: hypothetical protein HYZ63_01510 [Candidatus Andersenbacteria bacterium]|nr:hypothetical protein [Candidatus Andersenbacteria bacterium]
MDESPQSQPAAPMPEGALSKAERKRLRRAEKTLHREREMGRQRRGRILTRGGLALLGLVVVGFIAWKITSAPKLPTEGLVSNTEVHWHARLDIKVRGENVEIPANIGVPVGNPNAHPEHMHTHAADHVIHVEKLPPVYETDLKLGNFFRVWGKKFTSQCVADVCAEGQEQMKMMVNGKENTQFENYLLRDGDQVEITLE